MDSADVGDLLALDRDVARAVARLERWREEIARDGDRRPEDAYDDPFEDVRRVSSKSTRDALAASSPSANDRPLRDALVRWTGALVQTRIGLPGELLVARESAAPRGRFDGDPPRLVSWRDAWSGILEARTDADAASYWRAAGDAAGPIGAAATRHAARRLEAARRLGHRHAWDDWAAAPAEAVRAAAAKLLDATEDLAREGRKALSPEERDPPHVLRRALARDAGDGWPARLSRAWLERTFDPFVRGLTLRLEGLPRTLGAASFARGLRAFGFAVRAAMAPASLPFALTHEPGFVAAHRLGAVFASLAADVDFQRRVLGVGRRSADAQARMIALATLFDARVSAARVLLYGDGATADTFEAVSARLFGRPIDDRLRGAWPRVHDDEPARFVALLEALALRDRLRDRYDVDWYRNPHAWSFLRETGSGPAREPVDASRLEPEAAALGRAFEEAAG